MIKNNQIVVVHKTGPFFYKMTVVNKNNYLNKKGKVKGRFLDIVCGGEGNITDDLKELELQEYIYVTEAGGNYLIDVN